MPSPSIRIPTRRTAPSEKTDLWRLGADFMADVQARNLPSAERRLEQAIGQIAAESRGRFGHLRLRTLQVLTNANRAAFSAGAPVAGLGAHNRRIVGAIAQIKDAASLVRFARRAVRRTIGLVPKTDAAGNSKAEEALLYIRSHLAEPVSRNQLAALLQCSPAHFSRLFSRATGLTFQDYLLRCRLEKAKALLRQSHARVAEVAAAVGYSDPFQFSKIFRKRIGHSPRDFRKLALKDIGMRLATPPHEKT